MKERPILFSGAMVRALLAGTKTQTRRVVKPQFAADAIPAEMGATNERGHQIAGHSGMWWCDAEGNHEKAIRCPYGQPGDRLWVRETFSDDWCEYGHPVQYRADGELDSDMFDAGVKWRPSIHMPRWASRITLEVTGVRVERLQDISEADARAEGALECDPVSGREVLLAGASQRGSFVLHYRDIWESINGAGSWATNPWVWVIEFRRLP